MPRSQQVKNSFQSGVLSPRLSLRDDSPKYAAALEQSVNFIVNPQGGIVFREGFENIAPTSVIGSPSRVFQFHKGGNESDMLVEVCGDGFIRFWIDGVEQADTVAHDYLQAELDGLYFTNQEVMAVICHADYPTLYIDIALDGSISGEYMLSNLVPPADYNDANSPTATLQGDASYNLDFINGTATTWNPSRNWILKYDGVLSGGGKEYEFSSTASILASRVERALEQIPNLQGTDTVVAALAGVAGSDFDTVDVTITGPAGGKLIEILPANQSADRYVTVSASIDFNDVLEGAWSYPTYVLEGGIYYQCILPHTPIDPDNKPPNATYWTALPGKPETFDWQYPDGNAWAEYVVGTPPDYLDASGEVSYSPGGRGFPTVCVVHQQRLNLMANPGFTVGIFGSRINNYRDFVRGPQDDDPYFFAIDTSDTPTIKWAESQQNLIIGTSSGDYNLTAEVTLSPSDIRALKQNNARSNNSKAVTINTDIFYIEQGKEKVRATGYIRDVQAQSSNDVSQIAEHLLNTRAKRIVLMQTPEVLVIILREDGSLALISYAHEQQMAAWYEFESEGVISDLAVCYTASTDPDADPSNSMNTDEDELWVVISYDGGVTHYLQKMPYPKRVFKAVATTDDLIVNGGLGFLVEQHLVCLDGWLTGSIVVGDNNIIPGLGQYEGMEVTAMVDDSYAGVYTVNDGAIILDEPPDSDVDNYEGTWAVGFAYTGTAKTFEMSVGNQRGSAIGTKRRWNKIILKTLDSALPKINGFRPADRQPSSLMGYAEIIRPGLQDNNMRDTGWGDGSITILQDRPYPTNLIGFAGEFTSNNA